MTRCPRFGCDEYDPYDPPTDEEERPEEYHALISGSNYGSIEPVRNRTRFSRRMGMGPARPMNQKTRCRLLSVLFGALGLVILIAHVSLSRKPAVPPLATATLDMDGDSAAVSKTKGAWGPSKSSEAPQTKTKDEKYTKDKKSASPVPVPAKSRDTSEKNWTKTTAAPKHKNHGTTTTETDDQKFIDSEDRAAEGLKKEAKMKYAASIKEASHDARDMVTVAKTAAATLEASALAAQQRAIQTASVDAAKAQSLVDSYANDLEQKSQQAAQLYEAYVAKATAAGEALQKVLTESSASASASDLVQAAKKIQTDWADYEHKRDAAAAALAHFKSASADAPHAGLYTNLPVVLMAEDWQPVQADVNQDLSTVRKETQKLEEMDWRQFVPGWGTSEAPEWAKWVPPIAFGHKPAPGDPAPWSYYIPEAAIHAAMQKDAEKKGKTGDSVDWTKYLPSGVMDPQGWGDSSSGDDFDWTKYVPAGVIPGMDGSSGDDFDWTKYVPAGVIPGMDGSEQPDWAKYIPAGVIPPSDTKADADVKAVVNDGRRRAFDNKYNKLNGGRRRASEGTSDSYLCLNEFGSLSAEQACEEMVEIGQTLALSTTDRGLCFNVPINKKDMYLCMTELDPKDSDQACKDMVELGMRLAPSTTDRGNCFLVPLEELNLSNRRSRLRARKRNTLGFQNP